MKVCNNCGSRLSCGCQRRTAKDGKACCSGCVAAYNVSMSNCISSWKSLGSQLPQFKQVRS